MEEYEYLQLVKRGGRTLQSYISEYRPGSSIESIACDVMKCGIQNESDMEVLCALSCFHRVEHGYGHTEVSVTQFVEMINGLCFVTWHNRHDEICSILQIYGDAASIPCLEFMVFNPPSTYDSAEPFSVGNRAVYAISYIGGPDAIASLERIYTVQENSIGSTAKRLLGAMTGKSNRD